MGLIERAGVLPCLKSQSGYHPGRSEAERREPWEHDPGTECWGDVAERWVALIVARGIVIVRDARGIAGWVLLCGWWRVVCVCTCRQDYS